MIALALFMMFQQPPQPAPEAVPAAQPAPVAQAAPAIRAPAPQLSQAVPSPAPAAHVAPTTLMQVKTIYVLPMGSAFDQHLANHLASSGLFEVVTEPARADAIFTDRLGKVFEKQLEELYPSPKPEPEKKAIEEEGAGDEKAQTFDLKSTEQPRLSAFGRGKGTLFLVGRAGRTVVWSTFEKPKSTRPEDLNESAKAVVSRLRGTIKKQAEGTGIVSK